MRRRGWICVSDDRIGGSILVDATAASVHAVCRLAVVRRHTSLLLLPARSLEEVTV